MATAKLIAGRKLQVCRLPKSPLRQPSLAQLAHAQVALQWCPLVAANKSDLYV
jgi:hypothetical protein